MLKAKLVKQLSFEMPDRPGQLLKVTAALSEAKVNIAAVCAYAMEGKAYFMLTTDSNARAQKALAVFDVKTSEEVVISVEMPNKVGELQKIAREIADAEVNIYYMYGTTTTGKTSTCIFSTTDDKKALKAIRK